METNNGAILLNFINYMFILKNISVKKNLIFINYIFILKILV
jgi:hypothetical protein